MTKAKGYHLGVGLNRVDPNHYAGWDGPLNACEADAIAMSKLLLKLGYESRVVTTRSATRDKVRGHVLDIAAHAQPGDIFIWSNSSHGGQLPDLNGDEADGVDETMCLFDGELTDDEVFDLLCQFQAGVRILMFSDSCHSGTVSRLAFGEEKNMPKPVWAPRAMPVELAGRVYLENQAAYDAILGNPQIANSIDRLKASVMLISGCADSQLSYDGPFNGLFTSKLLKVWNGGKFCGTYKDFHKAIVRQMPPDQTPQLYWAKDEVDKVFLNQQPFRI